MEKPSKIFMKDITPYHRSYRRLLRIFLGIGLAVIFLLNFLPASAVALEAIEDQIKSAMIINFIRFVKWPSDGSDHGGESIIVGVMGADSIMEVLKTQEGKIIDGKSLTVRRIDALKDISQCHVLFIGRSGEWKNTEILSAVQGSSVLTIGDTEEFCREGGMIRLFREKNNIRFEINNITASKSNLQLSSKLLEIATMVTR